MIVVEQFWVYILYLILNDSYMKWSINFKGMPTHPVLFYA